MSGDIRNTETEKETSSTDKEKSLDFLRNVAQAFGVKLQEAELRTDSQLTEEEREERDDLDLHWAAEDELHRVNAAIQLARDALARTKPFLVKSVAAELQNTLDGHITKADDNHKLALEAMPSGAKEDELASNSKLQSAIKVIDEYATVIKTFIGTIDEADRAAEKERAKRRAELETSVRRLEQRRLEVAHARFQVVGPSPDEQIWHTRIQNIDKMLEGPDLQATSEQAAFDTSFENLEKEVKSFREEIDKTAKDLEKKLKEQIVESEAYKNNQDAIKNEEELKQKKESTQLEIDALDTSYREKGGTGSLNSNVVSFLEGRLNSLPTPTRKKKLTSEQEKNKGVWEAQLKIAKQWVALDGEKKQLELDYNKAVETKRKARTTYMDSVRKLQERVYEGYAPYLEELQEIRSQISRVEQRHTELVKVHFITQPDKFLASEYEEANQLGDERKHVDARDLITRLIEQAKAESTRLDKIEEEWKLKAANGRTELEKLKDPAGLKHDGVRSKTVHEARQAIAAALVEKSLDGNKVKNAIETLLPIFKELLTTTEKELNAIIAEKKKEAIKVYGENVGKEGYPANAEDLGKMLDNLLAGIGPDALDLINTVGAKEVVDVYTKFNAKWADDGMDKLNSLLKTGLGGADVMKAMWADLDSPATTLRDLSDAFSSEDGPGQLNEIVTAMGGGKSGKPLQKLITDRYGGDAKKIKTKLYDEVQQKFVGLSEDRVRLFKAAPNFESKVPGETELNVTTDGDKVAKVRVEHFLDRHAPAYFNFGIKTTGAQISNIKDSNTQWPAEATRDILEKMLQEAIDATQDSVDPATVAPGNSTGDEVEIEDYGVIVYIAYKKYPGDGGKLRIDQFYPDRVSGKTAKVLQLTPQQFDKTDMTTLKKALGA